MGFDAPLPDGRHQLDLQSLPLLHPLRHGSIVVSLEVRAHHITKCTFDVHANHRGDEKLLEVRDARQGLALVDRHSWLTAAFAEILYARIVESMLGITISERAAALRRLHLALNAAAVEALWQHLELTFDDQVSAATAALHQRESLLDALEALTGARMHSTYARIGGVAEDIDPVLADRLAKSDDSAIASAARHTLEASGPIAVMLPKVIRIPHADCYDEIMTPHGALGMWIVGRGDKVPHRVHLRTPGFAALARLEREAVAMPTDAFLQRLVRTRLVLGEVSR